MSAPSDGSTVSGALVGLSATASDNIGISGVQFKLDTNTNIGSEDVSSPYSATWDSTAIADGSHTLLAVARDAAGNYATSTAVNITVDNTAPIITDNGSSSGTLAAGTASGTLAVSTDENAQCKYDTTANTAFGSMANTFTTTGTTTPTTSHSTTVTGLSNGTSYTYYVRCQDAVGNATTTDLAISFSVASPSSSSSGGGGGGWTPPPPTAPAGGFAATASASASTGKQTLDFTFGSDVTKIVIADNSGFAPASYINATPTVEWPNSVTGTLFIKFCNTYNVCTNPIEISTPTALAQPTTPTYSYTRDLTIGDTGADVTALQKFLIASGYTIPAGATGYFGSQTQSALAAYQKAHNINPPAGYFGSLTRASIAANTTAPATGITTPSTPSITRSLKQGDTDPDVLSLQQFLNTHGFTIAATGPGSPGHETNYFGPATYQAVRKFQAAYAEQILTPVGLASPTGLVGSSTLAEIKVLSGN